MLTGKYTEGSLSDAFNVDVTQLDMADRFRYGFYLSTSDGTVQLGECYKTESTHGWPITFYSNTITGNVTSDYGVFGWPLSIEGGLFGVAETTYTPGNNPANALGPSDPPCSQNVTYAATANDFTFVDTIVLGLYQSVTGYIERGTHSFHLFSGSPVWLCAVVTPTNAVNLLSFDAQFTSAAGSEGLLSIYWDTNLLGSVDERAVQPGLQHYALPFPNVASNTTHVLGLRLDPFTSVQSSILLTNMTLSRAGISQPFSLSVTTDAVDGLPIFRLTGQPGFEYMVEVSTNLFCWTPLAILANTNGSVAFMDPDSTNYTRRFYRAEAP